MDPVPDQARYPLCEDAYRRLSNALRIYAEASLNFPRLVREDREEAIDNHDQAFDAILQGIHSVCDAMRTEDIRLRTYSAGDIAACTIVRNARHHNAGLFRCWNQLVFEGLLQDMHGATMLMVEHASVAGPAFPPASYFVSFQDFETRINTPQNRIPAQVDAMEILNRECGFELVREHAEQNRFPANQVYINLFSFVCNAVTRISAHLSDHGCGFTRYDADVYATHFDHDFFDLNQLVFNIFPSAT